MSEDYKSLKDKSSFLFDVLKRYDHYIATTNFKIGLLMSFISAIVLGLIIRIMSLDSVQSGCNYLNYTVLIFSSLTILLSLSAAINLLRAVFPSVSSHDGYRSLVFFGDVANSENGADGYAKEIEEATPEFLIEDLSKQTFIVAGIVNEKFRVLKIAVRIVIYGVIPLLTISLLLLILKGWI